MDKTKNEIQSLCVLGSGAVGSFYGSKLQISGLNVEFQSKNMYLHGTKSLKVFSIWGNYEIDIIVHETPKTMKKSDLILVTTKITDIDSDIRTITDYLKIVSHNSSIILFLQNGINFEEKIQEIFPKNPILGGLAFTCINRTTFKEIHHLDYGKVKIGSSMKVFDDSALKVVQLFQNANIETEHLPSLRFGRYEKLLWNIPFNSLSVLLKSTTDRLVQEGSTLELAKRLMNDVYKIAKKENIPITKKIMMDMIQRTKQMRPYKTSMLIDHEANREIEVESILGEPLKIAKKLNVKVPYIECMYYLLKQINNSSQISIDKL